MKKRRQVTYLKEMIQDLSTDNDVSISKENLEFIIEKFLRMSSEIMMNEGIVDIHGTRFRITERKLSPSCGRDKTYKIQANISDELRDQAEKRFSI